MEGDKMSVIVLAGMIGAGKSTYTTFISEEFKSKAFYEQVVENPILENFYADPQRWAFSLQIFFLNTRFRSIKQALVHRHNVLDRSIYEDALFTKINYEEGNMSEAEMILYTDLLDNMMEELQDIPKKAPDLLIYLRGSLDTHLERIKKRGRPFEQVEGNSGLLDYYTKLHSRYDDWFNAYDKSPTLVIDIDSVDLEREEDRIKVMKEIKNALKTHSI
ncbi:deoxynucleoside kinase [Marinilactibacillus psychrotolerans]|uniref:Deoxynucleoside kinase n=3 Tax=Marinilactibacillus TaxID=191769 RepID=A0A5R9C0N6_9LACT|nr:MULTISPECIES: deoxynucleoside kinase [Marinilactibacillus]API88492.1 deoxynucleoside kinase [Marinilactibacillus sp. 15R]TLQ06222.1 deoxynucleoside kinase [Marinilactibacillus psychrotolerans]